MKGESFGVRFGTLQGLYVTLSAPQAADHARRCWHHALGSERSFIEMRIKTWELDMGKVTPEKWGADREIKVLTRASLGPGTVKESREVKDARGEET